MEYSTILESIVLSATVYKKFTDTRPPNDALFRQVFHASAKRMNLEMMLLIDCVQNNSRLQRERLVAFSRLVGSTCDVKAAAYKDVLLSPASSSTSNLYIAWYLMQGGRAEGYASTEWKRGFVNYIEGYCAKRLGEYRVREDVFFDEGQYGVIMEQIENYYRLDNALKKPLAKL